MPNPVDQTSSVKTAKPKAASKKKATAAPKVSNPPEDRPAEENESVDTALAGLTVSLPPMLAPPMAFYKTRHVELRCNSEQALKLSSLFYSLMHAGIEVRSPPDAIRWLLDQLPDQAPQS